MKQPLLITFGCSWTFGVGCGYQTGMTQEQYQRIAWDNTLPSHYSFRGILSKKYNAININHAFGGASNQNQFRLARNFFASIEAQEAIAESEQTIVIHCITSTARNELFVCDQQDYLNFKFDVYDPKHKKLIDPFVRYSYDHDNEIKQLSVEMNFMNQFYNAKNIVNIWADTFNHHDYKVPINGLLFEDLSNRDLMSQLAINNGMKDVDADYHYSSWNADSRRVDFLIEQGLLNPLSMHPTRQAHEQIASYFESEINKHISRGSSNGRAED